MNAMNAMQVIEPRWWTKNNDGNDYTANTVSCGLCFRGCNIRHGRAGKCGVRFNEAGTLVSPFLGRFCACAVDPIEKKPLYHWRSGSFIYSLGSVGCTMDCPFCQNHRIAFPTEDLHGNLLSNPAISPLELVKNIKALGLNSIAFTYNEPTLQAEYICDASPIFHENNIAVVLVTNGAMSSDVTYDFASCVDAANIDLKAFNSETYRRIGGNLETVQENIGTFLNANVHVELTNLVVPGLNDNIDEFSDMVDWIASISPEIPLHITRYFPSRSYNKAPTDLMLLSSFAAIAKSKLKHVHLGNV